MAGDVPQKAETACLSEQIKVAKQTITGESTHKPYFQAHGGRLVSNNYFSINGDIIVVRDQYPTNQLLSLKKEITPDYYVANFQKLTVSFEKELQRVLLDVESKVKAVAVFESLVTLFAELPFDKHAVEITKSKSIKLSLTFPGEKLLIVSKPFTALEDVTEKEIIYSLFINRELVASDVLEKTEFVEGFKKYLTM